MGRRIVLLALAAAILPTASARGASLGLKAGVNVSRFTGRSAAESDILIGFSGGGSVTIGLWRGVAVQPEVLFARKGDVEREETGSGTVTYTTKLDYVEFPLLLKCSFGQGIVPGIYAGPVVSVLAAASIEGRMGGLSATMDAKRFFKPYDAGLMVGGEVKTVKSALEVRYTMSMAGIGEQLTIDGVTYAAPHLKNSTITLLLGYCF